MTTRSSMSAKASVFTYLSASVGLVFFFSIGLLSSTSIVLIFFSSASFLLPTFAGLVLFPSTILLILVVQDMTKFFYIGKLITSADNTKALINMKEILWIGRVPFPFLDNAQQYILTISNKLQKILYINISYWLKKQVAIIRI